MRRGSTAWIHNNSNCSFLNLEYRIILRWIAPEYNAIGHNRMKISTNKSSLITSYDKYDLTDLIAKHA